MSWEPYKHHVFSIHNFYTTPYTFNNLEGDKYDYRLITLIQPDYTGGVLYFILNGDVTAGHYQESYIYGNDASSSVGIKASATDTKILLAYVGAGVASYNSFSDFYIYGQAGYVKTITGTYTYRATNYGIVSTDALFTPTDEITSLTVTSLSNIFFAGELHLMRRLKASGYQSDGWELIEEVTLDNDDINTDPVELNNLQGDVDEVYKIESELKGATVVNKLIRCYVNDDFTETNYYSHMLYNSAGAFGYQEDKAPLLHAGMYSTIGHGEMIINAKTTGYQRQFIIKTANPEGVVQFNGGGWWLDKTVEINKLTLKCDSTLGLYGKIRFYKKSKKRNPNLIYDYDVNGDFSAGYTFKNLKEDKLYEIVLSDFGGAGASVLIGARFNDDATASIYEAVLVQIADNAISTVTTARTFIGLLGQGTNLAGGCSMLLYPKTRNYRPMLLKTAYEYGGGHYKEVHSVWYKEPDGVIQDMTIFADAGTNMTGNIKVYEYDLSRFEPFIITVKTDNTGTSNDDQFTLPLYPTYVYNAVIDWGDGTQTIQEDATNPTHTYPSAGTYNISITGEFPSIFFNNAGDKLKLTEIQSWGDVEFYVLTQAFYGCANLITINDTKGPNIILPITFHYMFASCTRLTTIDTSKWDTSKVSSMYAMFYNCTLLTALDVSRWDTSNVTTMGYMLSLCTSLTTIDVSNFDTSKVTTMIYMFLNSPSLDADVSGFDIEALTTALGMMLSSGFSTTNYDLLLVAWEAQTELANVPFHAGTAKYNSGAPATARAVLVASPSLWTITDGGAV